MVHKIFLFVAFFFVGITVGLAQGSSGINTSSPNSKAALDINASPGTSQGILIPRLKTSDRANFNPLDTNDQGLMFYNINKDSLFYWNGLKWLSLATNSSATTLTGTGIVNKVAFWTSANILSSSNNLHWDNTNGFLGIGTITPNAPLQFSNSSVNRKIVLYETANNANEFYGFGINGGALRYQTDASGADHVFYAAASAIASNELMRIKGTGNVGIGIATPASRLHVSSISNMNLTLESPSTIGTWFAMGNSSVGGRYFQIISTGSANGEGPGKLLFGSGTVAGLTAIAMTIDNTLNVGIGTFAPTERLDVIGNIIIPALNEYKYKTPKTKYLQIPVTALKAIKNSYNFDLSTYVAGQDGENAYGSLFGGTPGVKGVATAPLYLPDGATVTDFTAYLIDTDPTVNRNVIVSLCRNSLGSINTNPLASVNTTDADSFGPGSNVIRTSSTILNPVINYSNYSYYIKVELFQANASMGVKKILIAYTVDQAD